MSKTPHGLIEEFPEHVEKMSSLKAVDAHFARLFDEYHEVNHAVYRAETRLDAISPFAEEQLRKTRVMLKDEIWEHLSAASPA